MKGCRNSQGSAMPRFARRRRSERSSFLQACSQRLSALLTSDREPKLVLITSWKSSKRLHCVAGRSSSYPSVT